jgi:hypothetical protein
VIPAGPAPNDYSPPPVGAVIYRWDGNRWAVDGRLPPAPPLERQLVRRLVHLRPDSAALVGCVRAGGILLRGEQPRRAQHRLDQQRRRQVARRSASLKRWRRRESNPLLLGASEVLYRQSFIPVVRTGGIEPPQREAAGLQPVELTSARRPREREG